MICVWPDGSYCYEQDLEEYLQDHSDDYVRVPLYSVDNESFDRYVAAVATYGTPLSENYGRRAVVVSFAPHNGVYPDNRVEVVLNR